MSKDLAYGNSHANWGHRIIKRGYPSLEASVTFLFRAAYFFLTFLIFQWSIFGFTGWFAFLRAARSKRLVVATLLVYRIFTS